MTRPQEWYFRRFSPILLLVGLIALGIILTTLDVVDWRQLQQWATHLSQYKALPGLLIITQALLFMFAQPGSLILWIAATIYPPGKATFILVCGSTLGAFAAYRFSQRIAQPWRTQIANHRLFRWLAEHCDFLMLCGLRVLPSLPHSLINYSAGILKLSLAPFLLATVIGFSIKLYLYTSAIHHALAIKKTPDLVRLELLLPLVLLAVLFLLGRVFVHRWQNKKMIHSKRDYDKE